MISKKLEDALNEQINKEFYSAYLYLGMAAHFESEGLKGFAKWMRVQALEEQGHAMKLYDYLFSVDAKPVLKAIKEAPVHYEKPPVEVIQEVLKHEQYVTASINSLYELALAEKDYKTQVFLQWYINEQVEEEENDRNILDVFKHINGNAGLLILDKALGERK
jgi:ferritin, putative